MSLPNARYCFDWLFKDLKVRKGGYVIAEPPNLPLIVFTISIALAVVSYPGFWQTGWAFIAYGALLWWGVAEARSGRSRFRKILGYGGILAVATALLLRLGF